jgi:heavy-metal-associated domain-containing protein
MPDLPSARITHVTTRRLRIKIPEKRRDAGFFAFVERRLAVWDSVERVETNPLTGSILIYFSNAERLILEAVAKNDFLDIDFGALTQPAEPVVTRAAVRSFMESDSVLRSWTANTVDMRGIVFLALFLGGLYQLLRGRLSTPAPTLLWYAGSLLGLWRDQPVKAADQRHAG